jgi:hypothetical protein
MPTKDIKQLSCFPIPGAYTCIINEAQRAYIARVLRERTVSHPAEFRDNIATEYLEVRGRGQRALAGAAPHTQRHLGLGASPVFRV